MDPILLISDYNDKKDSQPKVIFFLFVLVVTIYLLLHCQQSVAISWTITPTVQTQEIYSDNINLASSGNEKAAFVTSVNPGFSIKGQSTRSKNALLLYS